MDAALTYALLSPLLKPNSRRPTHQPAIRHLSYSLSFASSSRPRVGSQRRSLSAKHPLACGDGLRLRHLAVASAAAGDEPRDAELDGDMAKSKEEMSPDEAQEVWREVLNQFKANALRMQVLAMQSYDVYSKRTMVVLMEVSKKLRIQADKAQKDLSLVAAEISQEAQEYLKTAARNCPGLVKDITETFRSLGKLNGLSHYEDYHVGIPFGTFLAVGGFLNFMLSGSISAIRFGFILGLALLALSVSSLRSQKMGRQSRLLLKGQVAIASVIFIRELSVLCQNGWFPTIFLVLVSGTVTYFYIYLIMTGAHKGSSTESGS